MAQRLEINWDDQPLGEVDDYALAKTLGVRRSSVWYQRQRRCIAPRNPPPRRRRRRINWDSQGLGQESDAAIARRLGVATTSVHRQRVARGIDVCPNTAMYRHTTTSRHKLAVDWNAVPLGQKSDTDLAKELDVASQTVRYHRLRRGIARFSKRAS